MKRFWMQILLLPLFPLLGIPTPTEVEEEEEQIDEVEEEEQEEAAEESNKGEKGGKKGRTFTQEQVNAMMTEEKRQGKRSVLNALGLKSVEDGKRALAALKKGEEEDDDEASEKKAKSKKTNSKSKQSDDVTNRYNYLITCIKAGVSPDDADDVVDLVLKRMDDEDDFEDALKEFKKAKPAFFGKSSGTGNSPRGKKSSNEPDSLGARLGKQVAKSGKNPYFSD